MEDHFDEFLELYRDSKTMTAINSKKNIKKEELMKNIISFIESKKSYAKDYDEQTKNIVYKELFDKADDIEKKKDANNFDNFTAPNVANALEQNNYNNNSEVANRELNDLLENFNKFFNKYVDALDDDDLKKVYMEYDFREFLKLYSDSETTMTATAMKEKLMENIISFIKSLNSDAHGWPLLTRIIVYKKFFDKADYIKNKNNNSEVANRELNDLLENFNKFFNKYVEMDDDELNTLNDVFRNNEADADAVEADADAVEAARRADAVEAARRASLQEDVAAMKKKLRAIKEATPAGDDEPTTAMRLKIKDPKKRIDYWIDHAVGGRTTRRLKKTKKKSRKPKRKTKANKRRKRTRTRRR